MSVCPYDHEPCTRHCSIACIQASLAAIVFNDTSHLRLMPEPRTALTEILTASHGSALMDSMSNTPSPEEDPMSNTPTPLVSDRTLTLSHTDKHDLRSMDDDTLAVRIAQPLLALAFSGERPIVEHYQGDLVRDVITVQQAIVPFIRSAQRVIEMSTLPNDTTTTLRYYWSADNYGTWFSQDLAVGWYRQGVQATLDFTVSKDRWNEPVLTVHLEVWR